MEQVKGDAVLDRFHPQGTLPASDRTAPKPHHWPGPHVGHAEKPADTDELVEHFLIAVIDRLQALKHVLMRLPQIEHRPGMMGR